MHLRLQKTVLTEMTSCVISIGAPRKDGYFFPNIMMHPWSRQKVWLFLLLFVFCSEYAQCLGVLDHLLIYKCVHLFNDLLLMHLLYQANSFYVLLGARPIQYMHRSIMSNAGKRERLCNVFFPPTQTQHPLGFSQCPCFRSFIA